MDTSKAATNYFRKQLRKQKRRTIGMFILGLLMGGTIAFNIYYWFPLLQKNFDVKEISQYAKSSKPTEPDLTIASTEKEETANSEEKEGAIEEEYQTRTKVTDFKTVSPNYQDLNTELEGTIGKYNPSGTILAIKDNQVVLLNNYGSAKSFSADPIESTYLLASIQKMMTSILVMSLIEENKLSLDTPLADFYPNIPNSKKITIDQLLSMTSDLRLTQKLKNASSKEDSINYVVNNVIYDPMGEWKYSDVNYFLLASIIEEITGQSYESYFDEVIKEPLNLKHTGFFNEITSETHLIPSYTEGTNEEVTITDSDYINELGTGNMYISVADLLTTLQGMFDGKLVSRDTFDAAVVKKTGNYKYSYKNGFYDSGAHYVGHGIFKGYEPTIQFNKNASTAVIYLSNIYTEDKANMELAKELFNQLSAFTSKDK